MTPSQIREASAEELMLSLASLPCRVVDCDDGWTWDQTPQIPGKVACGGCLGSCRALPSLSKACSTDFCSLERPCGQCHGSGRVPLEGAEAVTGLLGIATAETGHLIVSTGLQRVDDTMKRWHWLTWNALGRRTATGDGAGLLTALARAVGLAYLASPGEEE